MARSSPLPTRRCGDERSDERLGPSRPRNTSVPSCRPNQKGCVLEAQLSPGSGEAQGDREVACMSRASGGCPIKRRGCRRSSKDIRTSTRPFQETHGKLPRFLGSEHPGSRGQNPVGGSIRPRDLSAEAHRAKAEARLDRLPAMIPPFGAPSGGGFPGLP